MPNSITEWSEEKFRLSLSLYPPQSITVRPPQRLLPSTILSQLQTDWHLHCFHIWMRITFETTTPSTSDQLAHTLIIELFSSTTTFISLSTSIITGWPFFVIMFWVLYHILPVPFLPFWAYNFYHTIYIFWFLFFGFSNNMVQIMQAQNATWSLVLHTTWERLPWASGRHVFTPYTCQQM